MNKTYVSILSIIAILFSYTMDVESKTKKKLRYIGSKKCKKCHPDQYASWKLTPMANAYDILKPGKRFRAKIDEKGVSEDIDYRKDDKCLECHTTGYNQPGGYNKRMPKEYAEEKDLFGVGCEMCHGAGGHSFKLVRVEEDISEEKLVGSGLSLPGRTDKGELCIERCHNNTGPFHKKFIFEKRVNKTSETGRALHEHFELKGIKHDFPLQVEVRYIIKKSGTGEGLNESSSGSSGEEEDLFGY